MQLPLPDVSASNATVTWELLVLIGFDQAGFVQLDSDFQHARQRDQHKEILSFKRYEPSSLFWQLPSLAIT